MNVDYANSGTIMESGRKAFLNGVKLEDCPISRRTGANLIHWWNLGWEEARNNSCSGENCKAVKGLGHSEECEKEHDSQYDS